MAADEGRARREEAYYGRRFARVLGILLALGYIPFTVLCVLAPVSVWGMAYLFGAGVVIAGMISSPWRIRSSRGITRIGLALLAGVVVMRFFAAAEGNHLTM